MSIPTKQTIYDLQCLIENAGPTVSLTWDQVDSLRNCKLDVLDYGMTRTRQGWMYTVTRSCAKELVDKLVASIVAESLMP